MKFVRLEIDFGHLGIGDFDPCRINTLINLALTFSPVRVVVAAISCTMAGSVSIRATQHDRHRQRALSDADYATCRMLITVLAAQST